NDTNAKSVKDLKGSVNNAANSKIRQELQGSVKGTNAKTVKGLINGANGNANVKSVGDTDTFDREKNALELISQANEKIPFLVENLLPKIGLAALIGGSDGGKSSMLRQLGLAIVTGTDFLGWKTEGERKSVVYLSTEDDATAISSLLKMQIQELYSLQNYDFQNFELQKESDGTIHGILESISRLHFYFNVDYFMHNIQEVIDLHRPDLIIIDAFGDIYQSELYETNKVRNFLNVFQQLAIENELCVMFLHHVGKRTEDLAPSKNNALGSQGFEAKMRLVVELKTDKAQPQKKYFCIVKGNYLPPDKKKYGHTLLFSNSLTFTNTNQLTPFENISRAGSDLSEKERDYNDIMQLRDEGFTYKEIGNKFGLSENGIRNRVKRYEEKLENLKEQFLFDENHPTRVEN
ncbi:MAG: AAA family ATPase, partial [Bacteroidales bacterium]|nr:AAA family ATPase [Bacteroidales bacterium]